MNTLNKKSKFGCFTRSIINELNDFYEFICQKKVAVIGIIFIAIATYLYEICNFTMTADEEREITNAIGTNLDITQLSFSEGRYGAGFIKRLFMEDGIFTPTYATFIAVVFLVLAALFWCYNFKNMMPNFKIRNIAYIIFGGIFITVPYASIGIMNYSTINTGTMIGVFMVPITMNFMWRFIKEKNIWDFTASVLLTSFILSIYQSLTNDLILASCICCICWELSGENNGFIKLIKTICIYIGNFTAALLIYFSTSNMIGTSGYTDSFMLWGSKPPVELMKGFISDWGGVFSLKNNYGGRYLLLVSILYFFIGIIWVLKNKSAKSFYILILGIIIFPCSVITDLFVGNFLHPATHTSFMLLFGFVSLIAINLAVSLFRSPVCYYLVVICLSFVLLRQVEIDNKVYFGGHLCSQLDMQMGYAIGNAIQAFANEKVVDEPVVIVGKYRHTSPVIMEVGVEGRSIFLRKNEYKIFYLNYLGFSYKHPTKEQIKEAEKQSKEMPLWPLEGSIKKTGDVIIVHLSNNL